MVFINNQKFACESCIKGHRSSSCHHDDRPLFEVKKKGRPVSQCEKCRELRKTKKVHSKCECVTNPPQQPPKKQLSVKSKRFIPITPTLPNGVKDVVASSSSSAPPDPRAKVTSLLNPCHCKDVWTCKCRVDAPPTSSADDDPTNGLATLAQAAALRSDQDVNISGQDEMESMDVEATAPQSPTPESSSRPRGSCCSGGHARSKRGRQSPSPIPSRKQLRGPNLPPIRQSSLEAEVPSPPLPQLSDILPLSSVAPMADSGCSCGLACTCPGCIEHRGAEFVSKDFRDCKDGCGTCVDDSLRELPPPGASNTAAGPSSFIDAFFAQAAALPLPPTQRAQRINLDPTNVTVYPSGLFSAESKDRGERGAAFGLVKLPKLSCCAGRCGCPGDSCGCGPGCQGCCDNNEAIFKSPTISNVVPPVASPRDPPATRPVRSCCANKASASSSAS